MSIERPDALADRYHLGRRLGLGGYGETYHARDELTGRDVAVKLLRERHAGNLAVAERFRQEARTAASIRHPNVVTVYDHGHDGDRFFTVMELVPGGSLRQHIRERGVFPVPEAVALIQGVLDGLETIHRRGIIHRDVKPENILLTPHGVPKLTDFGIACATSAGELKAPGVALGTAAYMAPEQATGSTVSSASDLYAAGAVLYELLTGRPPFPGDEPAQVMYRHVFEPPPAPHSLNRTVPPALSLVVLRALAKEPERRYGNAASMRQAVAEALRVSDAPTLRARSVRQVVAPRPTRNSLPRVLGLAAASLLVMFVAVLSLAFRGGADASVLQPHVAAAQQAPIALDAALPPSSGAVEPPKLVERIVPAITHAPSPTPSVAPSPVPTVTPAPSPTPSVAPSPTPAPKATANARAVTPTPSPTQAPVRQTTPQAPATTSPVTPAAEKPGRAEATATAQPKRSQQPTTKTPSPAKTATPQATPTSQGTSSETQTKSSSGGDKNGGHGNGHGKP